MSKEEEPERGPLAVYLRYLNVGFEFALAIVLGTVAGIWLDGRFGTGVTFTLIGLALGFAGGFYGLYRGLFPGNGERRSSGGHSPGDGSRGEGSSGDGSPGNQSSSQGKKAK